MDLKNDLEEFLKGFDRNGCVPPSTVLEKILQLLSIVEQKFFSLDLSYGVVLIETGVEKDDFGIAIELDVVVRSGARLIGPGVAEIVEEVVGVVEPVVGSETMVVAKDQTTVASGIGEIVDEIELTVVVVADLVVDAGEIADGLVGTLVVGVRVAVAATQVVVGAEVVAVVALVGAGGIVSVAKTI